ncbi:MAG: hypothetical protein AMK72_06000 [Planctomycetes bacterium SM23_25]|nr:MAG: hypothetical protein AMK72_06000 [Planctomycetes bacterium SM23_25]
MTENHPTVQALRKKIANIESGIEKIEKEIEETPEEAVLQRVFGRDSSAAEELAVALAAVQSQVDMATRELDRLEKRQRELQAVLADYAPVRQQYLEVIRKCDELESEKANWQKRLTEVQMALSAEVAKRRTRAGLCPGWRPRRRRWPGVFLPHHRPLDLYEARRGQALQPARLRCDR